MEQEDSANLFSSPPTVTDLMDAYAASEVSNPKSLFYNRKIVRPKISILKIVLWLLVSVVLSACGAALTLAFTADVRLSVLASIGILVLICILFAKRIVIALVRVYQTFAPETVRKRCRYEPSCSAYMILALEKYGFWRGVRKGIKRWKGCRPPNGGYDFP